MIRRIAFITLATFAMATVIPFANCQDKTPPAKTDIAKTDDAKQIDGKTPDNKIAGFPKAKKNAPPPEGCAECGACGGTGCAAALGGTTFFIVAIIVVLTGMMALNIALLVFVARDAKSRGMDSAVIWMMLAMATGPVGLMLYIFSRPQGQLVICEECGNTRLKARKRCPHCEHS